MRLTCLAWPNDEPEKHIFEVEPDDDGSVSYLKNLIKDKHFLRHPFDACNLMLWKCTIACRDPNLKEILKAIHFDHTDPPLIPPLPISKYFPTGLPRETIHILVKVPMIRRSECGIGIFYSTTEA
jgi:hypothetical protein